eukprot:10238133-Alexandrium_andersonii.AAC.1
MSDSQNTTITFGANSGSSGDPTSAAAAPAVAAADSSSSSSDDEQDPWAAIQDAVETASVAASSAIARA